MYLWAIITRQKENALAFKWETLWRNRYKSWEGALPAETQQHRDDKIEKNTKDKGIKNNNNSNNFWVYVDLEQSQANRISECHPIRYIGRNILRWFVPNCSNQNGTLYLSNFVLITSDIIHTFEEKETKYRKCPQCRPFESLLSIRLSSRALQCDMWLSGASKESTLDCNLGLCPNECGLHGQQIAIHDLL